MFVQENSSMSGVRVPLQQYKSKYLTAYCELLGQLEKVRKKIHFSDDYALTVNL